MNLKKLVVAISALTGFVGVASAATSTVLMTPNINVTSAATAVTCNFGPVPLVAIDYVQGSATVVISQYGLMINCTPTNLGSLGVLLEFSAGLNPQLPFRRAASVGGSYINYQIRENGAGSILDTSGGVFGGIALSE